jgi:hypothetical protein
VDDSTEMANRRRSLKTPILSEGLVGIIQLAEAVSVAHCRIGIEDDREL